MSTTTIARDPLRCSALTLHALRLTLGDDSFFAMLRSWTQLNRHATVTTDMFIEHAARFSDQSLAGLFDRWLFRAELPELPGRAGGPRHD